jgi:hypothetical protein
MRPVKGYLTNISLLALVAANAVPLVGVLFLQWDAFAIVALYWAENVAVGFYNVLRIAFAKVQHPIEHLPKLFMIPFFIIHYGAFTAVHGFFILAIFKNTDGAPSAGRSWPCFLVFVQMFLNVIRSILLSIPPAVRLAVLSLFISHGVSFVYNYLIRGEYAYAKPGNLMGQPYSRVVVMHISILAGAFLLMMFGSPIGLLVVLIVAKTILDVKLHLREHRKMYGRISTLSN